MSEATGVDHRVSGGFAIIGCNEDHRNANAGSSQFYSQINPGFVLQLNVQYETISAANVGTFVEIFNGLERFGL